MEIINNKNTKIEKLLLLHRVLLGFGLFYNCPFKGFLFSLWPQGLIWFDDISLGCVKILALYLSIKFCTLNFFH